MGSYNFVVMCIVDQQVQIPPGGFQLFESHDDSTDAVEGQLLGYSIDAVGDYAIVSSNSIVTLCS